MGITAVIIIGSCLVAAIIGVDIYLAADSLAGNTWSEIIRTWGKMTPAVPWVCGVLSGHFFHPVDKLQPALGQPASIALLVWLTALVVMIGLACLKSGHPVPIWMPFIPAFVAGALLWPV